MLPTVYRKGVSGFQINLTVIHPCDKILVTNTGKVSPSERKAEMSESNKPQWDDFIDWSLPVSEEDVWQAIADANGLDYSEIADGDLVDWL